MSNKSQLVILIILGLMCVAAIISTVKTNIKNQTMPNTLTIEEHDYFETVGYYGYISLCHKGNCRKCQEEKTK